MMTHEDPIADSPGLALLKSTTGFEWELDTSGTAPAYRFTMEWRIPAKQTDLSPPFLTHSMAMGLIAPFVRAVRPLTKLGYGEGRFGFKRTVAFSGTSDNIRINYNEDTITNAIASQKEAENRSAGGRDIFTFAIPVETAECPDFYNKLESNPEIQGSGVGEEAKAKLGLIAHHFETKGQRSRGAPGGNGKSG